MRTIRQILKTLAAAHDSLTRLSYFGAMAVLALMATTSCFEVGLRYFFNSPTRWVSDYLAYGLCLVIFFAVPELTRMRGHVAITFALEAAPPVLSKFLRIMICLLGALACLAAAGFSSDAAIRELRQGEQTVATIPIPKWWISSFIAYGFGSASLHFARQMLGDFIVKPSEIDL